MPDTTYSYSVTIPIVEDMGLYVVHTTITARNAECAELKAFAQAFELGYTYDASRCVSVDLD
jgi:hypothetical protein